MDTNPLLEILALLHSHSHPEFAKGDRDTKHDLRITENYALTQVSFNDLMTFSSTEFKSHIVSIEKLSAPKHNISCLLQYYISEYAAFNSAARIIEPRLKQALLSIEHDKADSRTAPAENLKSSEPINEEAGTSTYTFVLERLDVDGRDYYEGTRESKEIASAVIGEFLEEGYTLLSTNW